MVTLTVLHDFSDLKEGVLRRAGESFECTEQRAGEITSLLPGFAEVAKPARKQTKAR